MSRERQTNVESSTSVPGYIVTFSDMITLLLTFFVMLISLSTVQDEEMFKSGRDSFVESISSFGLGILYGKRTEHNFGHNKIKYFIADPDGQFEGRSIDAREEGIRRIFKKVSLTMQTKPSQIVSKRTNFSVTNIRFPAADASLNEASKRFLRQFCLDLQQVSNPESIRLYVLGLAGEQSREKEQWILSAKRARVVAEFLQELWSLEYQCPIYWWGAGPGGGWVEENGPISKQSQILIAVLRAKD